MLRQLLGNIQIYTVEHNFKILNLSFPTVEENQEKLPQIQKILEQLVLEEKVIASVEVRENALRIKILDTVKGNPLHELGMHVNEILKSQSRNDRKPSIILDATKPRGEKRMVGYNSGYPSGLFSSGTNNALSPAHREIFAEFPFVPTQQKYPPQPQPIVTPTYTSYSSNDALSSPRRETFDEFPYVPTQQSYLPQSSVQYPTTLPVGYMPDKEAALDFLKMFSYCFCTNTRLTQFRADLFQLHHHNFVGVKIELRSTGMYMEYATMYDLIEKRYGVNLNTLLPIAFADLYNKFRKEAGAFLRKFTRLINDSTGHIRFSTSLTQAHYFLPHEIEMRTHDKLYISYEAMRVVVWDQFKVDLLDLPPINQTVVRTVTTSYYPVTDAESKTKRRKLDDSSSVATTTTTTTNTSTTSTPFSPSSLLDLTEGDLDYAPPTPHSHVPRSKLN